MNTDATQTQRTLGSQADNDRLTGEEILSHPAIEYLIEHKATQTAAAKKFGLAQQTVSNWVKRLREEGFAHHLPRHLQEPRGGGAVAQKRYPIYATVPAGYRDDNAQYDMEPLGWYTADEPVRLIGERLPPFAFTVVGDSMTNPEEPVQFEDGDVVLIDPNRAKALDNYDFVVACDYLGKMTLKQFVLRPDGVKVLHPLNRAYPDVEWDDETWWIAGVVVEGKRPERLLYSKNAGKRRR